MPATRIATSTTAQAVVMSTTWRDGPDVHGGKACGRRPGHDGLLCGPRHEVRAKIRDTRKQAGPMVYTTAANAAVARPASGVGQEGERGDPGQSEEHRCGHPEV
jgi:hypothetical protein